MRLLVHDPMKTVSTLISRSGVPAVRPMYSSARATLSRTVGSSKSAGEGTEASIGATCAGFVPQDTYGLRVLASMVTSLSHTASGSECNWAQSATAASQAEPLGALARPWR